jgi:hypothetical protein
VTVVPIVTEEELMDAETVGAPGNGLVTFNATVLEVVEPPELVATTLNEYDPATVGVKVAEDDAAPVSVTVVPEI